MTTKEIIKKLQEIDPSGNLHVRPSAGGAICGFHKVEGYYDGAYEYLDLENDILIHTIKGYKIDVDVLTVDDIIDNCDGKMEEIRKLIDFDVNHYYAGAHVKAEDDFWDKIEKKAKVTREQAKKSLEEYTFKVLKNYKSGYTMIENKSEDKFSLGYYWIKNDNMEDKNVPQCGELHAVITSGFFTKENYNDDYCVWKLNF